MATLKIVSYYDTGVSETLKSNILHIPVKFHMPVHVKTVLDLCGRNGQGIILNLVLINAISSEKK